MKKLLTFFLVALLTTTVSWAETITFDATVDKGSVTANGTTQDGDQVTKNGVTVKSTNGVMGNGQNYRVYSNGTLRISTTSGTITKVEVTFTASGTNNYGPSKLSAQGYTYSGYVGTWQGTAATYVNLSATAQVRITQIVVTTAASTSVATIAEAYATNQGTQFTFTGNAVVTYQNGRNVWIRDNSGSGLIYRAYTDQGNLDNGDILDAGWSATNTVYNDVIPEFSNPTGVTSSSNGGTVAPFDKTSTGVTTANVNEYVSFNHVTLAWDSSVGYCYATFGNNRVYFRNNYFNNGLSVTSTKTYDIEGIVYIEGNNTVVYLTSVTEIQTSNPRLEVSPEALTISDSGTNNTLTITGENINGSINAALANNTDWYLNPNTFSNTGGTATVTYNGRALSATNTVNVTANGAQSVSVPVNYIADLYVVTDNGYTGQWDFYNGTSMTNSNGVYTATFTTERTNTYILFARKLGDGVTWNTRYVFGPDSNGDYGMDGDYTSWSIDLNDDDPIRLTNPGTYHITINSNNGTFTIEKETVNTGDFVLVTDAGDLVAGNEVIFVSSGSVGSADAMSTNQATNNRPGTTVNVVAGPKVAATDATQIFTLEGDANGWSFKTVNGDNQGYIYAASSNGNQLKTQASASDNAKATISIGSNGMATIDFQGSNTHNRMRYNPNNGNPIFSCYTSNSTTGSLPYIYQRTAGGPEPSIEVDPNTINIVIPAGETSEQGTATVTENNTTGTTSVSVSGEDASLFTATLNINNGTLTVTYSGTATASAPDVAVVTLDNDGTTATVNVTGYKVPMTVTITPGDGHTFSTSTVTGLIESNASDALIEYSFDGSTWYTYDADEGFTTPEVSNIGGTVTVYARATKNGDTATAQATYTRVAQSKKCTAEIVFDPTTNNGGVELWSTLQEHMSDGVDYISDASMATVFTSNDYDAMRFGSGNNVGHMTFTLSLKDFDGGACKLTKVTINAARYSNDTDCELNVSTDVNTTGQTLSITADQTDFADYVFNFNGSEITTLTIANLATGKRVYVHSITLEYECPNAAPLYEIERDFEPSTTDRVAVTDRLIGVWAAKNMLWCKDQNNASIDATSIREGEQLDYVRMAKLKSTERPFQNDIWDQSNWVVLDFTNTDADASEYVGFEFETNSIVGYYVDDMNYKIQLENKPPKKERSMSGYPGFTGDPEDLDEQYSLNHYVSSNFYEPNLNWGGHDGFWFEGSYNGQKLDTCIFFMNPKIQEIAQVWAVWNADQHQFTIYERDGFKVNGYGLDGAFTMTEDQWQYNRKETASGLTDDLAYGSVEESLIDDAYYIFHVVIMRSNYDYGHRKSANQPSGKRNAQALDSQAVSPSIVVYPLDLTDAEAKEPPTEVREILDMAGKTVEGVRYYNVMGMESSEPFEGINIVVTRYSDGSFSTAKVLK